MRTQHSDATASPSLSIIVATYNAAGTLARCFDSIRTQDFADWELLVADGDSTDGTLDIIDCNSDIVDWHDSRKDSGIYDAWNRALAHAKGEYVCFLGADDVWHDPLALSRLFDAAGSGDYDLVSSRGLIRDPATGRQTVYGGPWDYRRLGRRMVVCHPGLLHRRSLFDTHGAFDTYFRIAGDLDFLLRLPSDLRTLHVDAVSVGIDVGGVSRKNVLARLREQRTALSRCPRYGPVRAYLAWLDKLWRYPVATAFGLPH